MNNFSANIHDIILFTSKQRGIQKIKKKEGKTMSKFNEVWELIHEENKKAAKGKKKMNVPYSKKKEDTLTQALLNDAEYEAAIFKSNKNGGYGPEISKPVSEFRRLFVGKVLTDSGIDKQQAADTAAKYEFTVAQAHAFNELAKENTEQFMRCGFTYKFHDKEDFSASIKMHHIDERVTNGRVPNSDVKTKTHEDEHMVIVKKSGTPRWGKTRIE